MKALNPQLAITVGEKAAIVFQHICYWMQTQSVETVYRTNKDLASDLEGMFSEQQIQRAKKKLIDNGMIEVSFNKKNVWNRTTHYTLTEKGKQYLLTVATELKEKTPKISNTSTSSQPSKKIQAQKNAPTQHSAETQANKDSFKEGFTNKNAIGMPEEARSKLLGLIKKKPKAEQVTVCDQDWEDVISAEREARGMFDELDQAYSQEDYNACDIAMLQQFDKPEPQKSLSLNELMSTAFKNAVTPVQEELYKQKVLMQNMINNFSEDY